MNRIFIGDCRDTMRDLLSQGIRVQTCVTSPPYYGLRDYGCDGQLGLESTPDEYIANMVGVFRLVRDLLADDGTLWLNIGDSYAANRSYQVPSTKGGAKHGPSQAIGGKGSVVPDGLKPKDLIGIPWMLAFALRADGWWLRQDIVWSKPNVMPEGNAHDRCTKSHEYIFLLSKSARYFFDEDSIKEKATTAPYAPKNKKLDPSRNDNGHYMDNVWASNGMRQKRSVWTVSTKPYAGAHFAVFPPDLIEPCVLAGSRPGDTVLDPFIGSGTTAQVAQDLGRQWIGCELNAAYVSMQVERTAQQTLVL